MATDAAALIRIKELTHEVAQLRERIADLDEAINTKNALIDQYDRDLTTQKSLVSELRYIILCIKNRP